MGSSKTPRTQLGNQGYEKTVYYGINEFWMDESWFVIGTQGVPCKICADKYGKVFSFNHPNAAQALIDKYMRQLGMMQVIFISYPLRFEKVIVDI